MSKIPKKWFSYFWFCDPKKLDLMRDRHLIVHALLAFGTLDDTRKLIRVYGRNRVRSSFIKPYRGFYSAPALNFAKFFLNAPNVNDTLYVKHFGTSSRTTG